MEASMGAWGSVSEHGAASESGLGTAHSPVVETESFGSAVGKVRWAPRLADGAASGAFWASSAGGPDHRLALWGVVDQDSLDEDQGPRESMAERLSVALPAEVGDLAALGEGRVAVGLADGRVAVVDSSSGTLQSRFSAEWGLKGQGVSSTALQGTSLAVGGDKGHLLLLDLQREAAERSLEASSVTVWSLAWTGARTLVSAGANGLLCLWDLREADKASGPFPLGGRAFRGGLFSVAAHPSQPHLVAAGGLGRVGLVDLRSPNVLLGETLELGTGLGAVWEAAFHPEHPRHLFVVAEDGSLLRLAAGEGGRGAEALKGGREGWAGLGRSGSAAVGAEAWLSGPSIGGLNSLDVQGPRIVVGADAFALHLLHGFMLTD